MSMKSAEERADELLTIHNPAEGYDYTQRPEIANAAFVPREWIVNLIVQERRDALEAAAEICQQFKLKYMQPVDGEFKSGYAVGMNICEDEIHKLMEGLK